LYGGFNPKKVPMRPEKNKASKMEGALINVYDGVMFLSAVEKTP
jgi:hypothetical protein